MQNTDQIMLRLPKGLRDVIKKTAVDNERTMNAEVVYHLRRIYGQSENEKSGTTA